jgi:hypothetical protein
MNILLMAYVGTLLCLASPLQAATMAHPPKFELAVGATLDAQGRLWLVQVEAGRLLVSRSDDGGAHFSTPVVALAEPEAVVSDSESRPRIVVARDGTVMLAWTQDLPEKKYSGNIRFVRSANGGNTWGKPVTLNDDGLIAGHRFASVATDGLGRVALVWLDARERAVATGTHDSDQGLALYAAESTDNGQHFSANRRIAAHTCECCRTALNWSPRGPVAFWRNLYDAHTRDFALSYLDSGVVERATDDDWRIDACPHHGGGVAVDASGRVHIVWFTNGQTRQGLFYANRVAGRNSMPVALGNADAQAGHADVAAAGKLVLLTWREFDGQAYRAMAMRSDDAGASWLPPQLLARSTGLADYPLPLTDGKRALVVWRSAIEGIRVLTVADGGAL